MWANVASVVLEYPKMRAYAAIFVSMAIVANVALAQPGKVKNAKSESKPKSQGKVGETIDLGPGHDVLGEASFDRIGEALNNSKGSSPQTKKPKSQNAKPQKNSPKPPPPKSKAPTTSSAETSETDIAQPSSSEVSGAPSADDPSHSEETAVQHFATLETKLEQLNNENAKLKMMLGQLSPKEIILSVGVLIFSTIIMFMPFYLALKQRIGSQLFFKTAGLSLVICAGLFLIVAGYTQNQIGPVMGLLGTIAGYILGKNDRSEDLSASPSTSDQISVATIKDELA